MAEDDYEEKMSLRYERSTTKRGENEPILISYIPDLHNNNNMVYTVKFQDENSESICFHCLPADTKLRKGGFLNLKDLNADEVTKIQFINADKRCIHRFSSPTTRELIVIYPLLIEDLPNQMRYSQIQPIGRLKDWLSKIKKEKDTEKLMRTSQFGMIDLLNKTNNAIILDDLYAKKEEVSKPKEVKVEGDKK